MYEIILYYEDDKSSIIEFLDSISKKERAKVFREIGLLKEFEFKLTLPHAKKMTDSNDLWELRIKHSTNNFRVLYFHYINNQFVLLHAFRKTSQKTRKRDIDIVLKRKAKYIERC